MKFSNVLLWVSLAVATPAPVTDTEHDSHSIEIRHEKPLAAIHASVVKLQDTVNLGEKQLASIVEKSRNTAKNAAKTTKAVKGELEHLVSGIVEAIVVAYAEVDDLKDYKFLLNLEQEDADHIVGTFKSSFEVLRTLRKIVTSFNDLPEKTIDAMAKDPDFGDSLLKPLISLVDILRPHEDESRRSL